MCTTVIHGTDDGVVPFDMGERVAKAPATEEKRGMSGCAIVGLVTAGVGVAALGLGSAFGVVALGKKSDSNPHCNVGGN